MPNFVTKVFAYVTAKYNFIELLPKYLNLQFRYSLGRPSYCPQTGQKVGDLLARCWLDPPATFACRIYCSYCP